VVALPFLRVPVVASLISADISHCRADEYSLAEYIGIVDSDSYFSAPVLPSALFEQPSGKPRVIGYNGCCTGWSLGVQVALGLEPVAEFMVGIGFPFIVKRVHFKHLRVHVTSVTGSKNFDDAWYKICSASEEQNQYSQFDIIGTYLWHFHHDDYDWHIKPATYRHHNFPDVLTNDSQVLLRDVPHIGIMQHGYALGWLYDFLCLASDNLAGGCSMDITDEIRQGTIENYLNDGTVATSADWQTRGLDYEPLFKQEVRRSLAANDVAIGMLMVSCAEQHPWGYEEGTRLVEEYLRDVRSLSSQSNPPWAWQRARTGDTKSPGRITLLRTRSCVSCDV